MVFRKVSSKNKVGIFLAVFLTLTAMLIVYSLEFTVSASTDESLETAINEYNFTTDVEVDVLDKVTAGKYLFVLYSQIEYEGWGGIARLERGILGRYRFKDCNNINWPLYNAKAMELGRNYYLLIYGLNSLPGVSNFKIEDSDQVIVFQSDTDAYTKPFIELVGTDTLLNVSNRSILYYDESGRELSVDDLTQQFQVSQSGDGASVGSVEQGLIYVLLGIILAIGLLVIRSLWKAGLKEHEEVSP